MRPGFALQDLAALIHQKITDVTGAAPRSLVARQSDGLTCDLLFRIVAATGHILDGVAVLVTRGKVHPRVDARGVRAEFPLHETVGLNELAPIGRAQKAKASDAVADRNLVGRLALARLLEDAF